MKQILDDALKTSGMTIIQVISGLIVSIVLARHLGVERFGQFSFLMVVCASTTMVFNPCIYTAANFHISSRKMNQEEAWSAIIVLTFALTLLASPFALVTFLFFSESSHLPEIYQLFLCLIFNVFGGIVQANFSAILYGSKRIAVVAYLGIIVSILRLVGFLLLVTLFPDLGWFEAFLLQTTISLIGAILILAITFPGYVKLTWNPTILGDLIRYGINVYPGRLSNYFNYRIDAYLVTSFLGESAFGIYSVATNIAEMLWHLPKAVGLILIPNFARLRSDLAIIETIRVSRIVFLLTFIQLMFLLVLTPIALPLFYGSEFSLSVRIVFILAPGILMFSIVRVLEPYFQSRGNPGLPSRASVFSLLVNVVSNFILIPTIGLFGAALSSTISYSFLSFFLVFNWSKIVDKSPATVFLPSRKELDLSNLTSLLRELFL